MTIIRTVGAVAAGFLMLIGMFGVVAIDATATVIFTDAPNTAPVRSYAGAIQQVFDDATAPLVLRNGTALAFGHETVWWSDDLEDWTQIASFPDDRRPMESKELASGTILVACHQNTSGGGTVFRSEDGGLTWTYGLNVTYGAWKIGEDSLGHIYVGEYSTDGYLNDKVWMSDDDGVNWELVFTGGDGTRHMHEVYCDSLDRVWIGVGDNDTYRTTYMSDDYGQTWDEWEDAPDGTLSMAECGDYLFFGGDRPQLGCARMPLNYSDWSEMEQVWTGYGAGSQSKSTTYKNWYFYDMTTEDGVVFALTTSPDSWVMTADYGDTWYIYDQYELDYYFSSCSDISMEVDGKSWFLIGSGQLMNVYKAPKFTQEMILELSYSTPPTESTVDLSPGQVTHLAYYQFPMEDVEIQFEGWDTQNIAQPLYSAVNMNPSFEDDNGAGSPKFYSPLGNTTSCYWNTTEHLNGTHSLAIRCNGATYTENNRWQSNAFYNISAGAMYCASIYMKANREYQSVVNNWYISASTGSGTVYYSWMGGTVTTDWQRFQISFVLAEDATSIRLNLRNTLASYPDAQDLVLYFDDFQLEFGEYMTDWSDSESPRQTNQPNVTINGDTYYYGAVLSDGSTSSWQSVPGVFADLKLTNGDQKYKLNVRGKRYIDIDYGLLCPVDSYTLIPSVLKWGATKVSILDDTSASIYWDEDVIYQVRDHTSFTMQVDAVCSFTFYATDTLTITNTDFNDLANISFDVAGPVSTTVDIEGLANDQAYQVTYDGRVIYEALRTDANGTVSLELTGEGAFQMVAVTTLTDTLLVFIPIVITIAIAVTVVGFLKFY